MSNKLNKRIAKLQRQGKYKESRRLINRRNYKQEAKEG